MFKSNINNLSPEALDMMYRTLPFFDVIKATSDDPDVQVASFVLDRYAVAQAANRLPEGILVDDLAPQGWRMGEVIVHSERRALQEARRAGMNTTGAAMVCSWFPCVHCAQDIAGAGITRLVCQEPDYAHPKWAKSFDIAGNILDGAGVVVEFYEVIDHENTQVA